MYLASRYRRAPILRRDNSKNVIQLFLSLGLQFSTSLVCTGVQRHLPRDRDCVVNTFFVQLIDPFPRDLQFANRSGPLGLTLIKNAEFGLSGTAGHSSHKDSQEDCNCSSRPRLNSREVRGSTARPCQLIVHRPRACFRHINPISFPTRSFCFPLHLAGER